MDVRMAIPFRRSLQRLARSWGALLHAERGRSTCSCPAPPPSRYREGCIQLTV
ncbi:hypothetical protein BDV96DRAFT_573957 [Lophiotrema nucula]|uniref:Uncharacterized protein n=1 Tax=Lophiotrema nucula TaxID=690887 RepID=A0A6A5ZDE6_9PLEO|nr:hypothetical protein BDV96DRAFT_573957 [Lophiotrema nucula]